jgi:hypothetical protein
MVGGAAQLLSLGGLTHHEMSDAHKNIPLAERIVHVLLSIFLICYGVHGLLTDDLFLPSKHGRGTHLHGTPMVLMIISMACATIVLMSTVIDYYDRRDNDRSYKLFARIAGYCGWTFFVLSLAAGIYQTYSR